MCDESERMPEDTEEAIALTETMLHEKNPHCVDMCIFVVYMDEKNP